MIISIDFDGTIIRGKYPAIDGLMPYAKESIRELKDAGLYIIINTCRSGDHLTAAVNYLLEQGVPFDRVNDNHPEQIVMYNNNSRKIYAHVYIDDKNIGGFPGWLRTVELIYEKIDEYEKVRM